MKSENVLGKYTETCKFWTLRMRNTSLSFSKFLPNENQILMNTITKIAISLTANIRKLYFSSKWFVLDTICHRLPDVTLGWIALTSCLVHGKGRLFTPGRNDLSIFGIVLFVFWYSNTYCIRYFSSPATSLVNRPTICLCSPYVGCPFHRLQRVFSQITI